MSELVCAAKIRALAAQYSAKMEKSGLVGALASNGSRELIVPKRDE